jgi:hypothetical protein
VSFRRSKNDGFEQRRWRVFCAENQELIASIDLPSTVVENQERFEDLLMHGYLDHHDDPAKFTVDKLDSAKLEKFSALVDRYFEAGYFDPGLMAVSHEERLRLAKKFPDQFDKSLRES